MCKCSADSANICCLGRKARPSLPARVLSEVLSFLEGGGQGLGPSGHWSYQLWATFVLSGKEQLTVPCGNNSINCWCAHAPHGAEGLPLGSPCDFLQVAPRGGRQAAWAIHHSHFKEKPTKTREGGPGRYRARPGAGQGLPTQSSGLGMGSAGPANVCQPLSVATFRVPGHPVERAAAQRVLLRPPSR